jgi:hypothetical protein
MQRARHRVYHTQQHPSHLLLPLIESGSERETVEAPG